MGGNMGGNMGGGNIQQQANNMMQNPEMMRQLQNPEMMRQLIDSPVMQVTIKHCINKRRSLTQSLDDA